MPRFRPAETLSAEQIQRLLSAAGAGAQPPAPAPANATPVPALDGVRVVDLSTMVAAPVCARTLAEYGAEVIKVGSPRPLHGPRMTCWFGADVDQGKRSLLVDLKTEDGQRILRGLLEQADVLVHNLTAAAARRLGLQRERVTQINPRLVLCRVGAFEGPAAGSWAGRKGYDPVAQAASGIMLRFGSPAQPEYHGIASCVDYMTGYSAALAAALAILRQARARDGSGGEAVTSLAQGAQLAQAGLAFSFPGRSWDEPKGQQCRGDHALHRLYRARDGWLFLAAHREKTDAILAKLGCARPRWPDGPVDAEISACLERCLKSEPIAHWQAALRPLDVAVVPIRTMHEIRRAVVRRRPEARFVSAKTSVEAIRQPHPAGCEVDSVAPAYARLRRHPIRYLDPAPKPGRHSLEILEELGIPAAERKRLLDQGVVSTGLSDDYLPA
jgi:crotonobetainyl-CoA:carnitine CoA-transferase CaiB-like acyl-CoA transferase